MKAVFRHELSSYFTSLTGYIFSAFLLLFAGIYTMGICLSSGYANFEYVLGNMSFTFMIIVPVMTMRVISAERRQKTDNLLYSLPFTMRDVVIGKYLAMITVFLVPVLIIGTYPLILRAYGNVNLGISFAALLGFYLLGCALLSVGMFISSLTESMAASAGISFAVMLVNYFLAAIAGMLSSSAASSFFALTLFAILAAILFWLMTKNSAWASVFLGLCLALLIVSFLFFPDGFKGLVPGILENLSLFERFDNMLDGLLDLTTIMYYLSVSAIFTCLTVCSMDKRRWA